MQGSNSGAELIILETKALGLPKKPSTGQAAEVDVSPPWPPLQRGEHRCVPVPCGFFACQASCNRVLTHCHLKYLTY